MKKGEAKFWASLQRLRRPRWRPQLPQLTPAQWVRLALLALGIVATLLGIEGDVLQSLVELLVKE